MQDISSDRASSLKTTDFCRFGVPGIYQMGFKGGASFFDGFSTSYVAIWLELSSAAFPLDISEQPPCSDIVGD
jgi:hypothetical protein